MIRIIDATRRAASTSIPPLAPGYFLFGAIMKQGRRARKRTLESK